MNQFFRSLLPCTWWQRKRIGSNTFNITKSYAITISWNAHEWIKNQFFHESWERIVFGWRACWKWKNARTWNRKYCILMNENIAIEKFQWQSQCVRIWNALYDSRLHFKCRIHSIGPNCLLFYRTDHANGIWIDLSEMRYCIDAYVTNLHQNRIPWNDCAKSSYFRSQFACLLCWCPARHQSRNLSRAADEREMKRKCFFLSSIFHIILTKISFCSCGTWAFGYVLVRHL